MNGSSGVSGSRERVIRDDELETTRREESTSAIVNQARRDAGYKDPDVVVRGDDATLNEVLADKKTHVAWAEAVAGTVHGLEVAEAVGVAAETMHALGRWPHALVPGAALIAAHLGMVEMEHEKAAMKDGATRDQLHAAILDRLDVPAGYRAAEVKRLDVTMSRQGAASKISDKLGDPAVVATLQLRCDQGMSAARRMVEAGVGKEAFLEANPEIAKRYAEDVAFHTGFEAMTWVKKEAPETYRAEMEKVNLRDVRLQATNVAQRL